MYVDYDEEYPDGRFEVGIALQRITGILLQLRVGPRPIDLEDDDRICYAFNLEDVIKESLEGGGTIVGTFVGRSAGLTIREEVAHYKRVAAHLRGLAGLIEDSLSPDLIHERDASAKGDTGK